MALPTTMRSLGFTPQGVRIEDVARPAPELDEVLVKVEAAAGTHREEAEIREGGCAVVNRGMVGRVVAVGLDVPAYRLGDRVVVEPAVSLASGEAASSTFAPYVSSSVDKAVTIGLDYCPGLALVPGIYGHAHRVLVWSRLYPGERVLIIGAGSASGAAFTHLARLRGAEVTLLMSAHAQDGLRERHAGVVVSELDALAGFRFDVIADFATDTPAIEVSQTLAVGGVHVSACGTVQLGNGQSFSALREPDLATLESLHDLVHQVERAAIEPIPAPALPFEQAQDAWMRDPTRFADGPVIITFSPHGAAA